MPPAGITREKPDSSQYSKGGGVWEVDLTFPKVREDLDKVTAQVGLRGSKKKSVNY